MSKPNETQIWFDAVVDALIANGNTLAQEKRWSWDKEGGHCLLTRPIDFNLVKSNFEIPVDVILQEKYQRISTLQEYLDIGQRRPSQVVPFQPSPDNSNHRIPSWRPLLLQKGPRLTEFPVAKIETELVKLGAVNAGHLLKLDGYVEPYKSDYLNHSWVLKTPNGRVVGVFIQGVHAGITTFQTGNDDTDIIELIDLFQPLTKALGLQMWNDQHLTDVKKD